MSSDTFLLKTKKWVQLNIDILYALYDPRILTVGCWEHKFNALYLHMYVKARARTPARTLWRAWAVRLVQESCYHVMTACNHRLFNYTKDHSLSHLNFMNVKNSIYLHINIRYIVEYPICPYGFKYLVFPFIQSFSICTTFFCNLQIFPKVDLIKHIFFICVCVRIYKQCQNKIFKRIFFFTSVFPPISNSRHWKWEDFARYNFNRFTVWSFLTQWIPHIYMLVLWTKEKAL